MVSGDTYKIIEYIYIEHFNMRQSSGL